MSTKVKTASPEELAFHIERLLQAQMVRTRIGGEIDFKQMLENTSYATLTPKMLKSLNKFIKGKRVFDLGAGSLADTYRMAKDGAKEVIAIEKNIVSEGDVKNVILYPMYFEQFLLLKTHRPTKDDVAFISWPANRMLPGLIEIASACGTIIYVGKNTDGTCCAWPEFFEFLRERKVVQHIPDQFNCFIVYGDCCRRRRYVLHEEAAGLSIAYHAILSDVEEPMSYNNTLKRRLPSNHIKSKSP